MPSTLATTVSKILSIENRTNAALVSEFHKFMKDNDASERHQNNSLKVIIPYARFLGLNTTFYDVGRKEQITSYLDTKIKSPELDPDKKWITTWNHNLHRIKHFFRWLYNQRGKEQDYVDMSDWETPAFARIREKRTKRLSPYSETDIWDLDELLTIVKYENYVRNKAALTLFWDLDARNHEVTILKIRNIRLREKYGEGEVPSEAKTGSGPILLTCSFPYVRDLLNSHPFKNDPDARVICNLRTGKPLRPEAMWTMMKQLRARIVRMLENGTIADPVERQKLEYLLKTKKWNPYCLRHSAITSDADYLPEYAVKKKARWSMNSRQGARYIKRRIGNDLKEKILLHNGIVLNENSTTRKAAIQNCPRCSLINAADGKFCTKCSYPFTQDAYHEIKAKESADADNLRNDYKEMKATYEALLGFIQQLDQGEQKEIAKKLIEKGICKPL